jgi:hypothetical protein
MRWQYFGLAGPRLASVWPGAHCGTHVSTMFRTSSVAQVCAGGGSVNTSYPRWFVFAAVVAYVRALSQYFEHRPLP